MSDLQGVRKAFAARVREGLQKDGCQIQALPSFLAPPRKGLKGTALAMDCGGTNARGARVRLNADGTAELLSGDPFEQPLRAHAGSAKAFFGAQAQLLKKATPGRSQPLELGYCFSYPAEVQPNADANLLYWSKELEVPGVVGKPVGKLLVKAARGKGVEISGVSTVNDAVAALMGGAIRARSPRKTVALILGTGTNMSCFFTPEQAPKLRALGWRGAMAINLEHAQFKPECQTPFDKQVDKQSKNPGKGILEKMTSGQYLPLVFNAALPTEAFDPQLGSGQLATLRRSGNEAQIVVAGALLDRSADLVASTLAGMADLYGGGRITLFAEGSLFWKTPGFAERVCETFSAVMAGTATLDLQRRAEVNLVGAAVAALSRRERTQRG